MHKTIYIDPEDEITTIVVKIRHEAADEIFLVVPKNAMLVQGVINLEILRREATKVNKNLIFITNDKQTKNLLERLELNVRDGLAEDFSDENIQIEEEEFLSRSPSDSIKEASQVKRAEEIGSESFYEKNIPTEEIKRALLDEENLPQENKQERLIVNDNGHSPVVKKRDLASSVILKQKEAINNEERRRRVEKRELSPKRAPSKNMPLMGKLDPFDEAVEQQTVGFHGSDVQRTIDALGGGKTVFARRTAKETGLGRSVRRELLIRVGNQFHFMHRRGNVGRIQSNRERSLFVGKGLGRAAE